MRPTPQWHLMVARSDDDSLLGMMAMYLRMQHRADFSGLYRACAELVWAELRCRHPTLPGTLRFVPSLNERLVLAWDIDGHCIVFATPIEELAAEQAGDLSDAVAWSREGF